VVSKLEIIGQVFIAVLIFAGMLSWEQDRGRKFLRNWAEQNGYEIVDSKWSLIGGAFWWTVIGKQRTYYVRVRDAAGTMRSGWVLCGGWLFGILDKHAKVQWDLNEAA
jgi:hypothetical protein